MGSKKSTKWDEGLSECVKLENLDNFAEHLDKTKSFLENFCNIKDVYSKLSTIEKIKYDLFITYAVSSLFWADLKTLGRCPVKNNIKVQLEKVKEYSDRLKMIEERHLRPRVDKAVFKRVINHELWENEHQPNIKKFKIND